MYKRNGNNYNFIINKVNYTVEKLNNSVEIYETNNPAKTGFVFEDGMKQFTSFINTITDIAEDIGERDET